MSFVSDHPLRIQTFSLVSNLGPRWLNSFVEVKGLEVVEELTVYPYCRRGSGPTKFLESFTSDIL